MSSESDESFDENLLSPEQNEEEYNANYGLANIIDIALTSWASSISEDEELLKKVKLSNEELESLNMATAPIYLKLVSVLGITPSLLTGMIALITITMPRIFILVKYQKAQKKTESAEKTETTEKSEQTESGTT